MALQRDHHQSRENLNRIRCLNHQAAQVLQVVGVEVEVGLGVQEAHPQAPQEMAERKGKLVDMVVDMVVNMVDMVADMAVNMVEILVAMKIKIERKQILLL